MLSDADSCLNREKAKGEKRRKAIIAVWCRDAEDAEPRKRKVARTADTSGHWLENGPEEDAGATS